MRASTRRPAVRKSKAAQINSTSASSSSSGDIGSAAARDRRARTARRCRAPSPRYAAPPSVQAEAGCRRNLRAQLFRGVAQHGKGPVAGLAQFLARFEAGCRPRTWPNNRPARCARSRDRPCPADRAPRRRRAGHRPRRVSAQLRIARNRAARHWPSVLRGRGSADRAPPG